MSTQYLAPIALIVTLLASVQGCADSVAPPAVVTQIHASSARSPLDLVPVNLGSLGDPPNGSEAFTRSSGTAAR